MPSIAAHFTTATLLISQLYINGAHADPAIDPRWLKPDGSVTAAALARLDSFGHLRAYEESCSQARPVLASIYRELSNHGLTAEEILRALQEAQTRQRTNPETYQSHCR